MSGILDSKTRIVDIVMTSEGRSLLSQGIFDVSYASFTDRDTFYDASSISGSSDSANDRIFLEAPTSFSHDNLVIRTDDSGFLVPFEYLGTQISSDGDVAQQGVAVSFNELSNYQEFYDTIKLLTGKFVNNFNKHGIIASKTLTSDTQFKTSKDSLKFTITNDKPFGLVKPITTIEGADPLFLDKRLSHMPQFKFLPPVVEISEGRRREIGKFNDIKKFKNYTIDQLKHDVIGTTPSNSKKEVDETRITSTSDTNDMVLQFFELGNVNKPIIKLETVDFGEFTTNNSDHPSQRVVFVGKLFFDTFGAATFINLFTVVID